MKDRGRLRFYTATFSIVAADPERGDLGVAVASKFVAAGSIVPWAKPGVGAVATQSWANVKFGPQALKLLELGYPPDKVGRFILDNDPKREYRQLAIVDAKGRAFAFTGKECLPWAGHMVGEGYSAQGNILAGEEVVEAMVKAYESTKGELVDKLLAALKAGDEAGGDRRGKQSAAVYVVRPGGGYGGEEEGIGVYVDLRVDEHPDPVPELIRIFKIWELTILEREDPNDVYDLSEVAEEIQEALKKLGYYRGEVDGKLNRETLEALERWMGINNFENKMRRDGKIWGTVYRFLIEEARRSRGS